MNWAEYRKTAVVLVGFAATVGVQMFAPDTWQWKLAAAVLAAGTVFGVWRVPNELPKKSARVNGTGPRPGL